MGSGRNKAEPTRWGSATLLQWHLGGLVLILALPSLIKFGDSFWRAPESFAHQVWLLGLGYLLAVVVTVVSGSSESRLTRPQWVGIGTLTFAAASAAVLIWPELPYSNLMTLVAFPIGVMLMVAPELIRPSRRIALTPLALAALVGGIGVVSPGASMVGSGSALVTIVGSGPARSEVVFTGLHNVRLNYYQGVVPPPAAFSGGLVADGDSILFVTGGGDFFSLRTDGTSLKANSLPIPPPMDREAYLNDRGLEEDRFFRVLDLLIDRHAQPPRLMVTHHHWDAEAECVSMSVSWTRPRVVGDRRDGWDPWTTLYTTEPCLRWGRSGVSNGSGGRLVQLEDGSFLLSTGAHGRNSLAQDTTGAWGKILRIERTGNVETVSLGHRNPQGLHIAADGTVWSTEHGPQGGDELNLIRAGGNYGWPLATYGTEYGLPEWIVPQAGRDHRPFEEPAYVWMPALGLSNLIEGGGSEFPRWGSDLLIAAMAGRSVLRARRIGERIAYVERIRVEANVRDLERFSDGRILLWVDRGNFVVLEEARLEEVGAELYGACATCHEPIGGEPAVAPTLRGIYHRDIAALDEYEYSSGLRELTGRWTEDRLDSFLTDPNGFAPGTSMILEGRLGPAERRDLIEFLKTY